MAKTYFTADLHLGHRLVSGLRGFPDPAEHDAAVADRWRARVGGDDVVWVLGDLAVTSSRRGIDEVLGKVAESTQDHRSGPHELLDAFWDHSHSADTGRTTGS